MKTVGLRFLLDNSSFLNVIITEQEANTIVRNWMSGFFRLKDIPIIGSDNPPQGGYSWAVRVDQIQAIHVFELQEIQPKQPGIPQHSLMGSAPFGNKSGNW